MRCAWATLTVVAVGLCLPACHTKKNELDVPLVEEWRAPPNEERFNNPHEQAYRMPPPKQDFKPGFGGPNGPGPGSAMGGRGR